MTTRELIDAMAAGKTVDMESAFNAQVAERVAAKIEQMKLDMSQTLFQNKEAVEQESEEESEDSSVE
jgi:hypothetical protein